MSFLRGSSNYVWCTTSVLGKGATGAVFQGVNKNNGEPVAVKTFNQLSHMRPHDVQVREFEVLKKVKHENIVKLLAIEEEQEGRGKVIVMELCTGGSLFNILDDPENTYGLKEEEFLLVLEHLSAGMKHLRDNNLVHRDLKPGNIMKFISDNGKTVYKLTDFGAARELEEDQQFMSLYGTEEYLHPDMYERAVLRKPVGKTFGATVDLWSIGVTLYHVATGNLPFRPFGGRRNKETMYYITTKKASGVISGIQTSENGPIDWCRELPKNCQLSAGLKKHVTPLLAGLLEVDSQKIWTFDKFFTEVTNTLSRNIIHVYHINKVQSIRIYLHPEDKYHDFQGLVFEQTDVTIDNQILLIKDSHFLSIVEEATPGKLYPNTELTDPIFLFSKENNNVTLILDTELPKFPSFPNLVSVENDATLAKTACSIGHVCKRRVERLSMCSKLTHNSVKMFTIVVGNELAQIVSKCNNVRELTKGAEHLVDAVMRGQKTVHNLLGVKSTASFIDWREKLDDLNKELVGGLALVIPQLHTRYVTEQALVKEWDTCTHGLQCPSENRAAARARTLVDRLRDSWQHLLRDRATRSLTYNDEQFHVLERIKVAETGKRLKTLLEGEVIPSVTQLSDSMADWYKMAQTVYLQARILDKDADAFQRRLEAFISRVVDNDQSFHDELVNVSRVKGAGRIRGQELKSFFRTSIKEIINIQDEAYNVLKENTELVAQFQNAAKNATEEKNEMNK
ncbi:I-kappaB kinase epsilon [Lycorma delicatula]|uniref:I-kappaB kinase epsilon n=1 Tax=Lycorma delicatula TaxID=130591 RepID=UPI003F50FB8A